MKPASLTAAQLKLLQDRLNKLEKGSPQEQLLDDSEFQRCFRITRRTAYTWRKNRLLKFLLIRRRVFYRLSDIKDFLDKRTVE